MSVNIRDFGLSWPRIALFSAISVGAAVAEGLGMATLLPVLEYIEKGREVAALAGQSRLWEWIVKGFDYVGAEITLLSLLLVVLFVLFLRVGLMYARSLYTVWVTQDVLHTTRTSLFRDFLRARYSFFDTVSTGSIVNLVTTETTRLGGFFSSTFSTCSNLLVVIGYIAVLLWISVPITLCGFILMVAGGLLVAFYIRHTKRFSQETTAANERLSFLMVERLSAVRLLKLSAAERREGARLRASSEQVRDNMFHLSALNARIDLLFEPVVIIAAAVLLYAGVDRFGLSLSEIGLFMLVLLRLLPVVKEFMRNRQNMLANSASFQAVRDGMRQSRQNAEERPSGRKFSGLKEGVHYRNVDFIYPEREEKALDGVTLEMPAGKFTALVGPSGSGKSTLVDLLPRMRRPVAGEVFLDGTPLAEFDLISLRRGIAFVSQDAAIMNDTVCNNIAFVKDGATSEDVEEALEKARAGDFVRSLPRGLDTVLGERGLRLSGGQRQRLSLARAFVKRAPIMVLDEPTSALDSEAERDIQKVLEEMRLEGETTVIIIAHRLSTIRNVDKIVVLSGGRVIEEGTHEELMSGKSWYAKINYLQHK